MHKAEDFGMDGNYIEEEGEDDMDYSGMEGDEGQDVPIHLQGGDSAAGGDSSF